MKSENSEIKKGAIISYIAIFLNIVAGIVYTPWILKSIGDADYAIYTITTSLISMFLVDFGIGTSISKFVSSYIAEGKEDEIEGFLGIVYKLYLLIDAIIFIALVIVFLYIDKIYSSYSVVTLSRLRIVYIIVGTYSILQFPFTGLNGVLISYEKFVFNKAMDLFQKLLTIVSVVTVILAGGGLYGLVLVNSCIGLVCVFVKWCYIRHRLGLRAVFHFWSRRLLGELLSVSVWVTLIAVTQRFFYSIAPTILARYGTTFGVNSFSFASTLEGYMYIIGNAINGMFISRVTRMYRSDGGSRDIYSLMRIVGKFQMILISLIFIGWLCVGQGFVNVIWLGKEYEAVYVMAIILFIPDMFSIPQQIAATAVLTEDKLHYQAVIQILGALVSVSLSTLFVKKYDALGMSVAISIAMMVIYILMNFIYYRILSINIFAFFKDVYLRCLPAGVITAVAGLFISSLMKQQTVWSIIRCGSAVVFIYGGLTLFITLTPKERNYLASQIAEGK